MIKNILKLKLFVLCSMLFCSLVASVFFFGTSSKAYSDYLQNKYIEDFYNAFGYYDTSSNVNFILNYWDNNNTSYPYIFLIDNGTYIRYYFLQNPISEGNYGSLRSIGNFAYFSSNKNTNLVGNPVSGNWSSYNTIAYTSDTYLYEGPYDEYSTPVIDWDNPFYSANIPNPNIFVSYRNLNSTPVIDVPLNVSVSPFPVGQNVSEYYVQMYALVNMDFNYFVQNTRDGIVYNGLDMERYTAIFDIVTPQDYKVASDLSEDYIHLQLTNGWYNHYPEDNEFSFSFADGIPLALQSSAITKFHNFRKNATFADNTVYLYVRYFTIDESNNFVVGSWTIWKSYNPNEFYAELPSYYVPYNIVPATQGTNSNVNPVSTASPEPSVIINPVNTNPSVNVTVTQNVPNYPDYPTIASYNKDNLLVDTINQLGSIESFFGEFGSFLVTAFAFMPAWIWAIIGVGFSLSIVVMFLKIL